MEPLEGDPVLVGLVADVLDDRRDEHDADQDEAVGEKLDHGDVMSAAWNLWLRVVGVIEHARILFRNEWTIPIKNQFIDTI